MGMFLQIGFEEDRRPVAAPAWLKLVCSGRSMGESTWQSVDVGAFNLANAGSRESWTQSRDAREPFEHVRGG